MLIGYARVSTDGQTLDAQMDALRNAGCAKIYSEKESGAHWRRPELHKMLKALKPGDVLIITRLDRLARSTLDLLNIVEAVKQAGASFKSIADAWADTSTPHGKLMLTVLGGLAEFERDLIKARTSEGRKRAKASGKHMGRPPKLTGPQRSEALRRKQDGEPLGTIALSYGVSKHTISRLKAA